MLQRITGTIFSSKSSLIEHEILIFPNIVDIPYLRSSYATMKKTIHMGMVTCLPTPKCPKLKPFITKENLERQFPI